MPAGHHAALGLHSGHLGTANAAAVHVSGSGLLARQRDHPAGTRECKSGTEQFCTSAAAVGGRQLVGHTCSASGVARQAHVMVAPQQEGSRAPPSHAAQGGVRVVSLSSLSAVSAPLLQPGQRLCTQPSHHT
jgi:hypothetical protein